MLQLYSLLGWPGLAGVAVMALMIPANAAIVRLMKKFQKRNLAYKDERTAMTTEILNNIKSIKLYSWTIAFADKLAYIRNEKEMKTLRKIGTTQAASRFCWMTTPFLVSCGTFSLYVLVNDTPLSIELVFPALTLFNLLNQPLQQLPNVITATIESVVAAGRLKSFLLADEVQAGAVTRLPAATQNGEEAATVRGGDFTWGDDKGAECLSGVNFTARKGQLNCIVGRVGSGKSSILQAILGDLHKLRGEVIVRGTVAYVAQNAWIMNASVKENVIFGHPYDPKWYNRTLKACALADDLAILPDGDRTEVGEKGISLSGGQKARLQLARAVYARADVYLLDDILSAVDAHVGRHIINQVVGPKGLLRGKSRILATNSIPVLKEANYITLVSNGKITEEGSYWDVISNNGEIAALIRTVKSSSGDDTGSPSPSASNSPVTTTGEMNSGDESDQDLIPGFTERDSFIDEKERRNSSSSFRTGKKGDLEMAVEPKKLVTSQTKEKSEKGKVKWSVYWEYAQACDTRGVFLWVFAVVSVQALQVGSSLWLKTWAESNERSGGNLHIGRNIGIYFALGMATSAMVATQTIIMWVFCSIRASKRLHERMARAMFRSPMSFFETTPMGRILNRFSSDMWRVDEALNRSFSELFTNASKAGCTLVVISASNPVFVAMLLPLGILYMYIQRYYLRSNRELKRLESVSRSPIYAHFAETLCGLSTIRAFRQGKGWTWENENRVDNNMKAWLPAIYANRWLGIRLEFIGALVVFSTSSLSILNVINGGNLSAGIVGLAMSYALQITQALNMVVRVNHTVSFLLDFTYTAILLESSTHMPTLRSYEIIFDWKLEIPIS
jgi:ATP-binding cassette, subfamily C (CFTR/MRP), member 1